MSTCDTCVHLISRYKGKTLLRKRCIRYGIDLGLQLNEFKPKRLDQCIAEDSYREK